MLFSLKNRKKEDKKQEEREKKTGKMVDMGDELDFPNDTPLKRPNLKQDSSLDFIADFGNDFFDSSGSQSSRKIPGWFEETPGKKSWLRRGSKNFLRDSPKKEIFMDSCPVNTHTSEIPAIPDLDDMKEEELSADVAKAPSLTVSRIATYKELDNDLSKHAAFQSLDGIELNLLTKRLLPEHLVRKDDETLYTWDTLFADISSHLNSVMSQDSNTNDIDKIGDGIEKVV